MKLLRSDKGRCPLIPGPCSSKTTSRMDESTTSVNGDSDCHRFRKIVKDSEHFHDEHHIWTEGYTVIRKFSSVKVPGTSAEYKMEVLRNPLARSMPLFRVTLEDGEQLPHAAHASQPACEKKGDVSTITRRFKENGLLNGTDPLLPYVPSSPTSDPA
eukprot:Gb_04717 [translate_table: standard]